MFASILLATVGTLAVLVLMFAVFHQAFTHHRIEQSIRMAHAHREAQLPTIASYSVPQQKKAENTTRALAGITLSSLTASLAIVILVIMLV